MDKQYTIEDLQQQQLCSVHSPQQVIYISIDTTKDNLLKCPECVTEEEISGKDLLLISSLSLADKYRIFPNWPIRSREFSNRIQQSTTEQSKRADYRYQISGFFKILRCSILKEIDEIEESMLKKEEIMQNFKENFFNLYTKLSMKEELCQILQDTQKTQPQKNKAIKQIIESVIRNEDSNKQVIADLLMRQKSTIEPEHSQRIIDEISNKIKQIDLFDFNKDLQSIVSVLKHQLPIDFKRTTFSQSQQIILTTNDQSHQIMKLPEGNKGQIVSDELKNDSAYILKVQFNLPFGLMHSKTTSFTMGLIPSSKKDLQFVLKDVRDSGFNSILNHGSSIIVKGKKISSEEVRKVTEQLEFRWCISKRQFYIADKNYQNINLSEEDFFSTSETYRFGIYFEAPLENHSITLIEFAEINPQFVSSF